MILPSLFSQPQNEVSFFKPKTQLHRMAVFVTSLCGALPHTPQGSNAPLTPYMAGIWIVFNTQIQALDGVGGRWGFLFFHKAKLNKNADFT